MGEWDGIRVPSRILHLDIPSPPDIVVPATPFCKHTVPSRVSTRHRSGGMGRIPTTMGRLAAMALLTLRLVSATWPATVVDTSGAGSLCEST